MEKKGTSTPLSITITHPCDILIASRVIIRLLDGFYHTSQKNFSIKDFFIFLCSVWESAFDWLLTERKFQLCLMIC